MHNIPVHEPLPADLKTSPLWLQWFTGLGVIPVANPLYTALDRKLSPAWLHIFEGQAGAPVHAPIVDKDKKVTLPWITYMQSLP